jgi:hypothetical protein
MAEVVARPTWAALWLVILLVWVGCGAWVFSSDTGRQALVDERVRVVEAFGGRLDDTAYARLQTHPPYSAYFTSGGRMLLAPPVMLAVAAGLWLASRSGRPAGTFRQGLAVAVHASVVLALGQLVALPVHMGRESLTSPFTLAVVLPVDEGTLLARVAGALDLFALWWMWLLALGAATLTHRSVRRPLAGLVGAYVAVVVIMAVIQALSGGA